MEWSDLWFVLLTIGVFALLAIGRASGGEAMSATNLVELILAIALTIFLIIALLFPERF